MIISEHREANMSVIIVVGTDGYISLIGHIDSINLLTVIDTEGAEKDPRILSLLPPSQYRDIEPLLKATFRAVLPGREYVKMNQTPKSIKDRHHRR
jgi:hypothetical protein